MIAGYSKPFKWFGRVRGPAVMQASLIWYLHINPIQINRENVLGT